MSTKNRNTVQKIEVKQPLLAAALGAIIVVAVTVTLSLCAAPAHASDKAGLRVVSEDKPLYACLSFSGYMDVYNLIMNGSMEAARRAMMNSKSCAFMKDGLEYDVIERTDRWVEIMIFHGDEMTRAYTLPTLE